MTGSTPARSRNSGAPHPARLIALTGGRDAARDEFAELAAMLPSGSRFGLKIVTSRRGRRAGTAALQQLSRFIPAQAAPRGGSRRPA